MSIKAPPAGEKSGRLPRRFFCAAGRWCAIRKSPRARGTPGSDRTSGLRHLATPERSGSPA